MYLNITPDELSEIVDALDDYGREDLASFLFEATAHHRRPEAGNYVLAARRRIEDLDGIVDLEMDTDPAVDVASFDDDPTGGARVNVWLTISLDEVGQAIRSL